MYFYKMIETHDLFLGRTTYGILATRVDESIPQESALIPGISCDRQFVETLMARCEQGQLSPIHMLDVVTDALE